MFVNHRKSILSLAAAAAVAAFAAPHADAAVTFGTDANGNAISWNHTAIPGGTAPAGGAVAVVGGDLQFTNNGAGNIDHEIQVSDAGFFGSNTSGTPFIEVSWIDENTGGTVPNIDFFATDTRPGKLSNRVTGGSLFTVAGHAGYARFNNPSTQEEYNGDATPRALAGSSVAHTLRIGKDAAGLMHFEFDGLADATPSSFLSTTAGLGTDHSAWGTLEVRVRGHQPGETFTFTDLSMGDDFTAVPEPAGLGLLALGSVLLLGRRGRRAVSAK